ncbi:BTAD domain-containing putative transcriptional regulator [Streptomyces sp. NPDC048507]|uniref:BTAD domain-containing putative transcriptional regulator n=1 Tax=Streptomyces sp. NPDC048507 TaxID=3365560 RepID=UPI0037135CA9
MVHIRVLGSFAAERDGEAVPLGGHRQRSVLALLVSARGRVVSVDRMIEELWQGAAPARAVASLQAYVSNLRRLLEPGRAPRTPARLLVSAPPGYLLRLDEEAVDAWRFERLLGRARALLAAEPDTARELLREALALWRGAAYADTADEPWTHPEIMRLGELRLAARELDVAAGLRVGDIAGAVADAALLAREEPLREEGRRLQALALWAAGRQADALAALRGARAVLAEEAGLDPGPALVALERAVLTQDDRPLREATAPPRPDPGPSHRASDPGTDAASGAGADSAAGPGPGSGSGNGEGGEPFVGREAEAARLAEAADRARVAGPGVVLVTGEAGLGKSALLLRLGERLRADGWLVAAGRTTDAEGAPPAWAWVEALRALAAAAPPDPGTAALLAPLLGEGSPAPGPAGAPGGEAAAGRFRLHRAVWRWLAEAARGRPLALVLDDLHWADAETLSLLAGAAELPRGARLLVVGAYRPDEVPGRLGETLAGLARHSPTRIALSGLSEGAVAELIRAVGGAGADPETVAALAARTGGNPFYVRESARLLAGEGSLVALSEVPDGVRDVLRRRLGRLPEPVVAVLRLAAVAGREAAVEVLVEAADADEDGVLAALEAGLLAGLLDEPGPGRVRFAHALVRDTLLADLSGLRAARMHGRIAACLERLEPDDVSALAHHHVRAVSSATAAKAVHYCLRRAALAEARYAYDDEARVLAEAVACAERIPADPDGGTGGGEGDGRGRDRDAERVDLLGRLVRAQIRAGAVAAARGTRSAAVERAVGSGRDDLLIRAFTAWTEPTPWQTRPYGVVDAPVVALLERLLERADLAPDVRCRLLGAYAAELSDAKVPRARAAAREALALAVGLGDPVARAGALVTLAKELDADREARERGGLGVELERLGAAHDLPAHRWYGMLVHSTALAAEGDADGARRAVARWTEFARTYRMPGPSAVGAGAAATLAHLEGRFEEAERGYAAAARAMDRQGSPHARGHPALTTAALLASRGREGLGRSLPWARQVYAGFGPLAGDILAASLAASGQARDAREARDVLALAGPLRTDYLFKLFATLRAMTLVMLGENTGAEELYAALLPYRNAPPPTPGFTVAVRPVARTLGELALLLGRPQEAAPHFARAAEIAARWRSPWCAAPVEPGGG